MTVGNGSATDLSRRALSIEVSPTVAMAQRAAALTALADAGESFDVIYVDPPYASDLYEKTLEQAGRKGLLGEDGVVVAEHFHKRPLPERIGPLARTREVRVGDHRLSFYRRQESAPPQP